MRKEFIIAIISGITIGVVIAFGIWRANTAINTTKSISNSDSGKSNQIQPIPENNVQLTIAQPEENDVIASSPVTLSGITEPDTVIVISGEQKDYIVKSSESGSFEQEVALISGVNEILFAYRENGDTALTKSLRVVYSTEFKEEESE
jgi:hypothetical protein